MAGAKDKGPAIKDMQAAAREINECLGLSTKDRITITSKDKAYLIKELIEASALIVRPGDPVHNPDQFSQETLEMLSAVGAPHFENVDNWYEGGATSSSTQALGDLDQSELRAIMKENEIKKHGWKDLPLEELVEVVREGLADDHPLKVDPVPEPDPAPDDDTETIFDLDQSELRVIMKDNDIKKQGWKSLPLEELATFILDKLPEDHPLRAASITPDDDDDDLDEVTATDDDDDPADDDTTPDQDDDDDPEETPADDDDPEETPVDEDDDPEETPADEDDDPVDEGPTGLYAMSQTELRVVMKDNEIKKHGWKDLELPDLINVILAALPDDHALVLESTTDDGGTKEEVVVDDPHGLADMDQSELRVFMKANDIKKQGWKSMKVDDLRSFIVTAMESSDTDTPDPPNKTGEDKMRKAIEIDKELKAKAYEDLTRKEIKLRVRAGGYSISFDLNKPDLLKALQKAEAKTVKDAEKAKAKGKGGKANGKANGKAATGKTRGNAKKK